MSTVSTGIHKKFIALRRQLKEHVTPGPHVDYKLLSSFEILPGLLDGREVKRIVLAIPTRGCALFRRAQGGCLHCGLAGDGIIQTKPSNDELIANFSSQLNNPEFTGCPVLCLYTPGSFLDEHELDRQVRNEILSLISRKESIRRVVLESLPQFITLPRIREVKEVLSNKEIEIAVGLDSSNDDIRRICIDKSFTNTIFEKACNLLRKNEIFFSAFALLKPPFLSEREAIDDTLHTARYAFERGVAAVSIEPNSVQAHTFTWQLYRRRLYRPPWLWSIIEIIRSLPPGLEIRVGGIVVYPRAEAVAYNCERCSDEIWQRIRNFNISQDRTIFDDLDCECKIQWGHDLKVSYPSWQERLESILQAYLSGEE
jgi:archaeosine synthase beta-subunit